MGEGELGVRYTSYYSDVTFSVLDRVLGDVSRKWRFGFEYNGLKYSVGSRSCNPDDIWRLCCVGPMQEYLMPWSEGDCTKPGLPEFEHILTNYENFRLKPFWQTGWLNIELEKWVFGGYCALMMLLFSCSCLRLSCSWLRLFKWFSICWKSSSRSFCACACLRFFSAL